ncbi:hypothetical protein AMS68_002503 [Peltaster fructicola]|uniref:U3 small nucleolar ribonucleoprotein protein MPP10 n=1 Tax=Peltaster fructicola TaxID=286661 RepID=A0A6H0XQL9_9PEZI|nr:hypothetical protein AMS68_002503 [Peltaster fructicola]
MAAATDTFPGSLSTESHAFLTPDLPLYTDVLRYLKHALDPIATSTSTTQQARLKELRKKRKRGETTNDGEILRLRQIHTDGLGIQQIWEQARRVIGATRQEAELSLAQLTEEATETTIEDESEKSELDEDGVDYTIDDEEDEDLQSDDPEDEDLDSDGEITNDALEDELGIDSDDAGPPTEEFIADKFGLNDGFFSIDEFNKQSEFLEQQDARGEDDGAASDEEDIDWDSNPLGQAGTAPIAADDDEDGPTFGDPDAESEDEEMSLDGENLADLGGMGNTNDVMYAEFFAPPAQKKGKNNKGRPNPHNFPKPAAEDDVQRTIDAVQRDLFEDEDEDIDEAEEVESADPLSRKSTHEKRKAAIAEEIRKLEAANVAKREWALSGEARAADRPMNSLLEEDLDFERTGKPVPVITAEISESIEELIKRRILAHDFQDIPRRRPDDLATGRDGRRGRLDFNLDDTKSKKGLADEYEEEYLRKNDPSFVDVKDEKLAKEQKEIEALWKDVCAKLDSLSSWHFRPRQTTAQLDIRVDAPTIAMEDARPNAGGEVAAASQLAPQEIYKAGESSKAHKEEVVGKSGLPAGREELSREDKKRRRRRDKERIRKATGNEVAQKGSKKTIEQKQVLGDLKKGGVKLIGKKGDMTNIDGKTASTKQSNGISAANLKL